MMVFAKLAMNTIFKTWVWKMDFSIDLNGETLEFFEDEHLYLVDGIVVPSITQILNVKFGGKYKDVPHEVLRKAAERGIRVHSSIEYFAKTGETDEDSAEFAKLVRKMDISLVGSEIPVILHSRVIAAGRLDLLITKDEKIGLADIKTTAKLDKTYLFYQLNLYRLAFMQCYDAQIDFLAGIHLRNGASYAEIPIDEAEAENLVNLYLEGKKC